MIFEVEEGLVLVEIKERKEKWFIIAVYNRKVWKETEERINKIIEEKDMELEKIIIGGDFNIRIGEIEGVGEEVGGRERKSKDKKGSNEKRKLIKWIHKKGWNILNGATKGDWEGEYTYVGTRGNTVIDYVITNEKALERIKEFKVGERIESDHMPLEIEIDIGREEKGRSQEEEGEEGRNKEEGMEIIRWDEEAIQIYKEGTEEWEQEGRTCSVEER